MSTTTDIIAFGRAAGHLGLAAVCCCTLVGTAAAQQGYGSYYGQTVKQSHGQLGTQSVGAYLYESTPYDPAAWVAAVLLVAGMALAGAAIPAIRAGRVDPARALRAD